MLDILPATAYICYFSMETNHVLTINNISNTAS